MPEDKALFLANHSPGRLGAEPVISVFSYAYLKKKKKKQPKTHTTPKEKKDVITVTVIQIRISEMDGQSY